MQMPEPLTKKEQQELLKKMPDLNVRKTLIEKNLRLVAHIAKKYSNTSEMQDDLISIGTIGLIKAIDTYDLDKKTLLITYAYRYINNEILMHLRKNRKYLSEISIETRIIIDDSKEVFLKDILPDPMAYLPIKSMEDTNEIFEIINSISNILYKESFNDFILFLYMISDRRQNEIGQIMGISQSYVSRCFKKLRKHIAVLYKKHSIKKDSDVYFFKEGDSNLCLKLKGFPLIRKELEVGAFASIADIIRKSKS